MGLHLTIEDIEKYLDTSDFSEEYLLWMEGISAHLQECKKCQNLLHKAIEIDLFCQEDNIETVLHMARQEEEIRRGIVICKLQQMYQEKAMEEVMQNAIRQMQLHAVKSYMLQVSGLLNYANAAREEAEEMHPYFSDDRMEIAVEDGMVVLKLTDMEKQKKFTAVLDRKEGSPIVHEAVWDEGMQRWIARFEMDELQEQCEVYIVD